MNIFARIEKWRKDVLSTVLARFFGMGKWTPQMRASSVESSFVKGVVVLLTDVIEEEEEECTQVNIQKRKKKKKKKESGWWWVETARQSHTSCLYTPPPPCSLCYRHFRYIPDPALPLVLLFFLRKSTRRAHTASNTVDSFYLNHFFSLKNAHSPNPKFW